MAIGQCWKTVEMDIHVSNVAARYLPGHGVVGQRLWQRVKCCEAGSRAVSLWMPKELINPPVSLVANVTKR